MEGDEGEELKPTLLMLMVLGGLIGIGLLASRSWCVVTHQSFCQRTN